ncbi:sensor domain-containing protein [Nocardia crassostreae]|uniref:sensor domain-containing protein n=1 Tax=Nocardia crassostreae TaxID=53428 RepID=UPI001FE18B74|nr:sensor domain-containing protein [Nocardia crassostreae]
MLPGDVASKAVSDLDGIAPGARVEPCACVPLTPTAGPVVSVGTDDDSRATLTVELVRTDQPLSKLRDQLQRCGTVRAGLGGTTATITTELDPPPPLDADDTLALRRTVSSEAGGAGLTRKMQSLVGQIGDVRINVTYMTYAEDDKADAAALDSLFTTALSKVRKG